MFTAAVRVSRLSKCQRGRKTWLVLVVLSSVDVFTLAGKQQYCFEVTFMNQLTCEWTDVEGEQKVSRAGTCEVGTY